MKITVIGLKEGYNIYKAISAHPSSDKEGIEKAKDMYEEMNQDIGTLSCELELKKYNTVSIARELLDGVLHDLRKKETDTELLGKLKTIRSILNRI